MNKILILLALSLLLTSCFGGDDANEATPEVENTVQEETINTQDQADTSETEDDNEEGEDNAAQAEDVSVREPVANEDVEIREAGAENAEYDVRANIENDPDATVVTEETFVVPTEPRAQEEQIEEVELSAENDALIEEVLGELLEDIDDGLDVIAENE